MSGLRGIYSPLLIAGDCEGTSRYNTSRISHLRAEPREIKINPALDEPNPDSFSVSRQASTRRNESPHHSEKYGCWSMRIPAYLIPVLTSKEPTIVRELTRTHTHPRLMPAENGKLKISREKPTSEYRLGEGER